MIEPLTVLDSRILITTTNVVTILFFIGATVAPLCSLAGDSCHSDSNIFDILMLPRPLS